MHIHIDRYAYLNTCIHRWDPRLKIVSLFALLIAFSFVDQLKLLPLIFLIALAYLSAARLPVRHVIKVIKYPALLLLLVAVLLTVSAGGGTICTWWRIKIFAQGVRLGSVIVMRSLSQFLLALVIFETTPFPYTIKALYLLHLPEKLVAIAFFSLRFIYVYLEQMRKMRIAVKLRGASDLMRWRTFAVGAGVIGSLLIRSFEQAEHINRAMVLRGYCGKLRIQHHFCCVAADYIKSGVTLTLALLVMAAEVGL